MSRVTDEMVGRAWKAQMRAMQHGGSSVDGMRAALEAVEAELAAPSEPRELAAEIRRVCGRSDHVHPKGFGDSLERLAWLAEAREQRPFKLSAEEENVQGKPVALVSPGDIFLLQRALDRALRTLGPQPAQGGEEQLAKELFGDFRPARGGEWTLEDGQRLIAALERAAVLDSVELVKHSLNECFPNGKAKP